MALKYRRLWHVVLGAHLRMVASFCVINREDCTKHEGGTGSFRPPGSHGSTLTIITTASGPMEKWKGNRRVFIPRVSDIDFIYTYGGLELAASKGREGLVATREYQV